MARINFYALPPAKPITQTQAFGEIELTMSYLPGIGFNSRREAVEAEMLERYVTGSGDKSQPETYIPPFPVRPLTGEDGRPVAVPVDADLCLYIAYFLTMNIGQTGEEPFSFDEWAALNAVAPILFEEILAWSNRVIERAGALLKNVTAAGADSPLPPAETPTAPVTPT